MANIGGEGTKYPPSEFSQKYAQVLAPNGHLVSPSEVFGEGKMFNKDVEEKTRLAFKVTLKKLDKLNVVSEVNKENLAREKIDQVGIQLFVKWKLNNSEHQIVECFPNTLPKSLPEKLAKIKWNKKAAEVGGWNDWWDMHEEVCNNGPTYRTRQYIVLTLQVLKMLQKQAVHIQAWWEFTGRPDPGQDQILASLQRLVSGVLTHPITIGKIIDTYTPKRKKGTGKISHD